MSTFVRCDGYDELEPLIDTTDEEALERLGTTVLARIPGTEGGARARLVACLLHGNEDSGYRAVLELLRSGERFGFDLWVLIGNVEAALAAGGFAHRYLDGQEDFNRVWGREPAHTPQRRTAQALLDVLAEVPLEASLDLHNTTGDNPAHTLVPPGSPNGEALAAICCEPVLRWRLDAHTLMEALAPRCPSVAVECGIAGSRAGVEIASEVLQRFLSTPRVDAARRPSRLYEMLERVVVRPEMQFAFGDAPADELDLVLLPGLDAHNFGILPAGTRLGEARGGLMPLRSVDMAGREVTPRTFQLRDDGALVTARDLTPVMMTRTVQQTRRDCLFYVAERC